MVYYNYDAHARRHHPAIRRRQLSRLGGSWFRDAHGREHRIREKVPVISTEDLDATSSYPRPGVIACEIISQRRDANGSEIVTITTERPWNCESTTGETEFDVLPEQLNAEPGDH